MSNLPRFSSHASQPANGPAHMVETDFQEASGRSSWGLALGILMVVGVSGGFWTGVGLLIAHFAK